MTFLRAVLAAVTWRKLLIVLALGFSMPALRTFPDIVAMGLTSALVIVLCAVANLFVALGADEFAKRRGPLRRIYPFSVVTMLLVNCTIAGIAQWHFGGLDSHLGWDAPTKLTNGLQWVVALWIGTEHTLWGTFVLFVYLNRRIAERMLQGVRETELQRVRLEGQLVESRLAAAQAQVDPQVLFSALADVRNKLSAAAPDAEDQLDDLIQHLRVAMTTQTARTSALETGKP